MNREELDKTVGRMARPGLCRIRHGGSRGPDLEARIIANVNSRLAKETTAFSMAVAGNGRNGSPRFSSCYVLLTRIEDHPAGESVMQKQQGSGLPPSAKQEQPPLIVQAEPSAKVYAKKHVPIEVRDTPKSHFPVRRIIRPGTISPVFCQNGLGNKILPENPKPNPDHCKCRILSSQPFKYQRHRFHSLTSTWCNCP